MADYGLIRMRLSDGRNLKVRGSVTEMPTNISAEAIVNQDNSVDRSFTARAFEFSIALAARDESGNPIDLDAILRSGPSDISLISDGEKSTTIFSRAVAIGEPSLDKQTGEVTGLSFKAQGRVVANV
jgi:hypothetical protein